MAKVTKSAAVSTAAMAAAGAADGPAINQAAFFKLAEAGDAGTFLTEDEAAGLLAAGFIEVGNTVDPSDASKRAVRLTEAGKAAVGDSDEADDSAASQYEIDDDVPLSVRGGGRGRDATYPFAKLSLGQSFHVAFVKDKPNFGKNLSSAAAQFARRFDKALTNEDGSPLQETVEVSYKQADGTSAKKTVTRQKMEPTIGFTVRTVGSDDKRGEGYRIYRTV